jgi:hypothetical protein
MRDRHHRLETLQTEDPETRDPRDSRLETQD